MEISRRAAMAAIAASAAAPMTSMLSPGTAATAGTSPVSLARSPVVRPDAEQWDMASKITGRTYRIFLAKPAGAGSPPPEGYPVIYLNDGDFEFHTAADALALQAVMGEVKPAYLVGIGYGRDWAYLSRSRFADLTPSPPDPITLARFATSPMMRDAAFGQAELFHGFMMEELRPLIEATYPVNRRDTSLFGHSLGGLFALHVLFNHPSAYRTYLAASPSINWAGGAILKDEAGLVAQLKAGKVAPRLLLTVGELEEKLSEHKAPPPGMTREQVEAILKTFAAVTNTVGLADRLKAVSAPAGTTIEKVVFEGETHPSVVPAAISRGVRFALPL
ncbi:MAG: putative esterase [Bradyrhizobium sp.]|nr:putative esterase [Bradyrhizobium sp.]